MGTLHTKFPHLFIFLFFPNKSPEKRFCKKKKKKKKNAFEANFACCALQRAVLGGFAKSISCTMQRCDSLFCLCVHVLFYSLDFTSSTLCWVFRKKKKSCDMWTKLSLILSVFEMAIFVTHLVRKCLVPYGGAKNVGNRCPVLSMMSSIVVDHEKNLMSFNSYIWVGLCCGTKIDSNVQINIIHDIL